MRALSPHLLLVVAALVVTSTLAACHVADPPAPSASSPAPPAAPRAIEPAPADKGAAPGSPASSAEARRFGAPIAPGAAILLSSVLAKPDEFASRTLTVEAKVRRNCTRRGCWMELAESADPGLAGCRVTFKDYGFFVPLDSAGSTARVQGTVEVQAVSAAEVQHLEGEGAKFPSKQPDGTAREVRMVATGVELWRGPG
jgi:hypothetical protein